MYLQEIDSLGFVPAYKNLKLKKKPYGLNGIRNKAGVYFIKEDGVVVYIGMSRVNLQGALYRHFQDWRRSWAQRRVFYKFGLDVHVYEVAAITTEPARAHDLEKAYIVKYHPRDNHDRYEEYTRKLILVTETEIYDGIYTADIDISF